MRSLARLLPIVAVAAAAGCADSDPLAPPSEARFSVAGRGAAQLSVMSRNLYIGADVDPVLAAIVGGDPAALLAALQTAVDQVVRTDFPTRIAGVADEIARSRPAVVGLQEAYNLDIFTPYLGLSGPEIHEDFIGALETALAARGLNYVVAVRNTTTDASLAGGLIHLVDHDALLVDPTRVTLLGSPVAGVYTYNLPLPPGSPVAVLRGYVATWAMVGGVQTLLVNTHLESGDMPGLDQLRAAQATELAFLIGAAPNVILTGDLNDVPGSLMYQVLAGAQLTDSWAALRPGAPGLTCCQLPDLSNHNPDFDQRIDYVWTRGFEGPSGHVQGQVTLTGSTSASLLAGAAGSVWASDHAGLIATLLLPAALVLN
jgi:endonuclease/exonuclease/phosphatase family metal-dependent hydrolase